LSIEYAIAETETFRDQIKSYGLEKIYDKIVNYVFPRLRSNPFYGPNIKKLKGDFSKIYRYRIGVYRLFYSIDLKSGIVFIISISQRKDSYKKRH